MVKGFGTTGGALLGGRPYPRSHNKKRVWNDMWSPVLRTLTQTRHLGARSGAWNDVRSAAWCAKWKGAVLRPYTGRLPRSPISEREAGFGTTWGALRGGRELRPCKGRLPRPTTNERRVLERHGKYVVEAMVRSGATALRGSFAQNPVSEREAGSGTT